MKTETREITPEMASGYLRLNLAHNRRLSDATVSFYAKQMVTNQWRMTGDGIKFSTEGKLIDGQHRLSAIVKSNKTITLTVISELEEDIVNVLDTGKSRSAGDLLSIMQIKNSIIVAPTVRFIMLFNEGYYGSLAGSFSRKQSPSNKNIQDFLEDNPEIIEIVDQIKRDSKKFKLISVPILCGLFYIFSKKSAVQSEAFFDKLITGVGIETDSPIYLTRDRFIRDVVNKTRLSIR